MIGGNKEYRAAVAFLNFRKAWKQLTEATKNMPDLDVSEAYPFFLLDFETIAPAVMNWAMIHAGRLMEQLPDIVVNPACLANDCPFMGAPLGTDGLCKGAESRKCELYPRIMFAREQVESLLKSRGYDTTKMNESEVQLLYVSEVNKAINEHAKI